MASHVHRAGARRNGCSCRQWPRNSASRPRWRRPVPCRLHHQGRTRVSRCPTSATSGFGMSAAANYGGSPGLSPTGRPLASWGSRVGAWIIDALIVLVPLNIVLAAADLRHSGSIAYNGQRGTIGFEFHFGTGGFVISLLVGILYLRPSTRYDRPDHRKARGQHPCRRRHHRKSHRCGPRHLALSLRLCAHAAVARCPACSTCCGRSGTNGARRSTTRS